MSPRLSGKWIGASRGSLASLASGKAFLDVGLRSKSSGSRGQFVFGLRDNRAAITLARNGVTSSQLIEFTSALGDTMISQVTRSFDNCRN